MLFWKLKGLVIIITYLILTKLADLCVKINAFSHEIARDVNMLISG